MTYPVEFAGSPVLSAELQQSYIGVGHAEIVTSGEAPLSGTQTLQAYGVAFVGAVKTSSSIGGRVKTKFVIGRNRMPVEVPAKQWVHTTVGAVIRETLQSCGETLSSTVDASILGIQLEQWKRNEQPASRALQSICDNQDLIWRTLRDGTIWVGRDEYPEYLSRKSHVLIDEDWSDGFIEIAPEAPDLQPGVTFRGQRIRHVVHRFEELTRSEAYLEPPSGLLDRFLAGIRQEIQFSRRYPARVVSQNSDGTLQIKPLDRKLKGGGLNRVKIKTGLPGFVVRVGPGSVGTLEFDEGDPSKSVVTDWERGANVVALEYEPGGVGSPACRVGDTLDAAVPMGCPVTGLLGGIPFVGVITVTSPLKAVVMGPGNSKLLI